jgi:hypothetical protein
MKAFFSARRGTLILVALIFSTNSLAVAPAPKRGPLTIKAALHLAQKLNTFGNYFRYADALNPGKGYDKWAEASEKSGASKNIPLNSLRVEGQKVYLADLEAPFEFSNDGRTVSYKGVGVEFKPGMTPEESFKISKKAWGGFREFKQTTPAHAMWNLFAPREARAEDRRWATAKALGDMGISFGGLMIALLGDGYAAGGVALAAFLGGEIIIAVGISLAVYEVLKYAYFSLDKKGDLLKDVKLECNKDGTYKMANTSLVPTKELFKELDKDEAKQADTALTKLCQNPAAVEDFNHSIFFLKKKILSGNSDFFVKSSTTFSSGDVVNPTSEPGAR